VDKREFEFRVLKFCGNKCTGSLALGFGDIKIARMHNTVNSVIRHESGACNVVDLSFFTDKEVRIYRVKCQGWVGTVGVQLYLSTASFYARVRGGETMTAKRPIVGVAALGWKGHFRFLTCPEYVFRSGT